MPSPERPFALAPAPRLSSRIRVFADYPPLSRRIGLAPDAYLIQRLCVFYKLGDRRGHFTDQELHMRQLTRLLRYLVPYWWQFIPSIFLLAAVGFLDAFRVLLIGPVLDLVLNPSSASDNILLFTIPHTNHTIYLQRFVPTHFHNAWTVVAFAFVCSTFLKGIFDYAGTHLLHYAVYGLITDLRNSLYDSILRRSSAFFQRHTTGTRPSGARSNHRENCADR